MQMHNHASKLVQLYLVTVEKRGRKQVSHLLTVYTSVYI